MTRDLPPNQSLSDPQARTRNNGAKSCIFPTLDDTTPNEVQSLVWSVPQEHLTSLDTFYKRNSSDLAPLLIAVWSIILHQFVGEETLYFGVNAPPGISGGISGHMQAFAVAIDPEGSIEQLLRTCDRQLAESQGESGNVHFNTGIAFVTGDEESPFQPESPHGRLHATDNEGYDLLLIVKPGNKSAELLLQYSPAAVSDRHAAILGGVVSRAVTCVLRDPKQKLRDLDLLDQLSKGYIAEWVGKRTDVAGCSSIAEIIQGQSRWQPGAPAVCSWDGALTYGELDELSTRLAFYLKERCVGPEVMVPVCSEKSIWAIVAMLAVLKVGAAFVPMDPSHPVERLKQIIAQVNAKVILSSDRHAELLAGATDDVVTVSEATATQLPPANHTELPRAEADNMAYVLFTSGSTGAPKGCVVDHRALATVINHAEALQISPKTRALQFASFAFGVSLIEIFCTLTAGGTICIPSDYERMNDLLGALQRMDVDWALLTPSLLGSVDPDKLTSLKTLVVAGEPLRNELARSWAQKVRLVPAYGLTEWAGICTVQHQINLRVANPKSIGKSPSANLWLVNPHNHDVLAPIGTVAELLIEGPCLARGYLHQAELTATMFIENPPWLRLFRSDQETTRLYKTGDLVRYSPDGSLIYIGRKSLQAKIRGQRIELGEVEYQVGRHFAGATKVIVDVVTPISDTPSPILVAFIYSKNGRAPPKEHHPSGSADPFDGSDPDFQSHSAEADLMIHDYLPDYMIPQLYVPLKRVPLTITGKIDRRGLREAACSLPYETLASYTYTRSDPVAPNSRAEQCLHRLLSDILKLPSESFSVNDSFFRLGGDSVKAMQLVTRCRAEGISITVQDVFREKTVSSLALLAGQHCGPVAGCDEGSETKFSLSAVQQSMMLTGAQKQSWSAPTACILLRLNRCVDTPQLEDAIRQVVHRHPMLRARFTRDRNGAWAQYVQPQAGYEYASCTVSTMEKATEMIESRGKILNVEKGPVFGALLLNLGEDQYLSLAAHSFVVDRTSLQIISQEIEDFLDPNAAIHKLKPQPVDFREWCCSDVEARHGQRHIPAPTPITPTALSDQQLSPQTKDVPPDHGHSMTGTSVLVPPSLLGDATKALWVSPSVVLQAVALHAFGRAFHDRELPLFSVEEDGRGLTSSPNGFSQTVGQFTTRTTLCVRSNGQSSFSEILRQTKESYQEARNGKTTHDIPSAGRQPVLGDSMRAPLPSILFNFLLHPNEQQSSGAVFEQVVVEDQVCQPHEQLAEGIIVTASERDHLPRMVFNLTPGAIPGRDLELWVQECRYSINQAVQLLEEKIPIFTPYDFPLLAMTREDLEVFLRRRLPEIDIRPRDIEAAYPCTPIQQGMLISQARQPEHYQGLFLWEASPAGGHVTIEMDRLQAAWRQLSRCHPILRTIFVEGVGASPYIQVVLKAGDARTAVLRCADEGDARSALHADWQIGGYGRDSLPRFTVCQTGDGKLLVALEISHVLMDATSMEIVKRDLALAYNDQLPSTSGAPYSDYVAYVEGSRSDTVLRYWREYLKGCSPCYFPRLTDGAHPGGAAERQSVSVPFDYGSELDAFCKGTGLTISNVVQVAWGMVLRAFTGLDSVLFGYVTSGRDAPVAGIEGALGPYINALVCRVDFDGSATLLETVRKAQRDFMQGFSSQHYSLAELFHSATGGSPKMFNTGMTFPPELQQSTQHPGDIRFHELERDLPDEYDITVEGRLKKGRFTAWLLYSPATVSGSQALQMAHNLNTAINMIIQQSEMPAVAPLLSEMDRRQLAQWNGVVPARVERCVHELIRERCWAQPMAPAVCAWDGEFTYGELDRLSSALAAHLASLEVGPEVLVPVMFEKSRWTPVAMLGVMKAGGAFVLLDPSHPPARLQGICQAVSASVVVASAAQAPIAEQWARRVVMVGTDGMVWRSSNGPLDRPLVSPDNALYAVFTSGSTGTPKGALITHSAYCTSALAHSHAFGLSANSRAFQFSSYAFDVSILEQLTTLVVGGCICIPSDADRLNRIQSAASELGVTWAELTPSTARMLDPTDLAGLETLVLIGEPVTSTDIVRWIGQVNLKNGYGPAECSAISTVKVRLGKPSDERNIGQGTGGVCWVAHPEDHDRLLPIGAVGELLIEGPIVGRGYLNDPEKTAAAFIDPPAWLRDFRAAHPGNPGGDRVYKTGDLVRYGTDGSLRFVGRKDTQIKLRGQRIELGEVEHNTRECFPGAREVVVEVVTPADDGRVPGLVAFVWVDGTDRANGGEDLLVPPTDGFRAAVPRAEAALHDAVPAYMVPAVFLPVAGIPLSPTGKTDRRRLRERAAALSQAEIESYSVGAGAKRAPATAAERTLQQLWVRVLNLPLDAIGADDSFFRLGGDSITAMQLSSLARTEGFALSVSDIFHSKTIAALAPFVGMDRQSLHVQESVDVPFDLSPVQRLFFDLQPNGADHFNQSFLIPLAASVATQDLVRAIATIVDRHSMLRARFSRDSDGGWSQVVSTDIESSYRYRHSTVPSLEDAGDIMHTSQQSLDFRNGPLLSVDLIDVSPGQAQYIFLVAHHFVIDFVSWRILLGDLEDLLRSGHISGPQTLPFQAWCQLQAEYARNTLDPAAALPLALPPAVTDYWGSADHLNHLNTCDNIIYDSFTVNEEVTATLFGSANDAFQTQPVEIFQAALWHAFVQTFSDRPPPAIYCESHGREPWDPSIDLSRTVGWFTTMWPLCIGMDGDSNSIVDVVRQSKDARRRTPSNGWAYFASRFLNPDGQQTFDMHGPVEIAFNYLGLYQQFEREGALLRPPITLKDQTPNVAGDVRRFALIDVIAAVNQGCLQFSFHYNQHMNHQDSIRRWMANCEKSLKEAADMLANLSPRYTLCDFPLLSLPYKMLDPLVDHINSRSVRTDASPPYIPKQHLVSRNHTTDTGLDRPGQSPSLMESGNIADILPATNCQEWFLHSWKFSLFPFSVDGQIDVARLQAAVQSLVEKYTALRTMFCEYHGSILQVILKRSHAEFHHIHTDKPLESILKDLSDQDMGQSLFSTIPLLKVTLVSRTREEHTLVIRMHHAQFDRYSLQPVLQDLAVAYNGDKLSSPPASFSDYVYYCHQANSKAANQFWREHLEGSELTKLPFSLSGTCDHLTPICESASIDLPSLPLDMTFPILVNAALSFVLGKLVNSAEVVFGVTVNTRSIPLQGIETILGPCLNILPFRVRLRQYRSVKDLCIHAQQQYANMLQYCSPEPPDTARPSTGGPNNAGFNYIVNNTHVYGGTGLVPLNGATWSELSGSEEIDLQNQVLIRSATHGGKLTIGVLTSADSHSREILSEHASTLAKNVVSAIQQFCEAPESDLSSLVLQL
ncbi:Nonribosomal Peptide Synthase (NRPS) [Aspergillus melleus]|uniref:Nonribosomal Peptide Synthase (NRPS) n=1 Tax=Aspergillus melleus TaxID=138277 RepID=A0ACC3AY09_9EURO|nr:Nonribosomal Peptide Synthase (NRPS) [Aspergillus melleus]